MDYTYSNITTFAHKKCHICNEMIEGECSTNIINNRTGPLKIQFFHIKCRKNKKINFKKLSRFELLDFKG